jgi:sporulation protein YlmC with PRC-barrel domain
MIRNLLAATAVVTVFAAGAFAQETTPQPTLADPATPAPMEQAAPAVAPAEGHLATNLVGEMVYNGTGDDAQNIGDVNDLVIDKDGKVKSIVIGVGGFLGLGEKSVEMAYDKIEWAEREGDRWIVVAGTKEELDALPAFDRTPYDPVPAPAPAPEATDFRLTSTNSRALTAFANLDGRILAKPPTARRSRSLSRTLSFAPPGWKTTVTAKRSGFSN